MLRPTFDIVTQQLMSLACFFFRLTGTPYLLTIQNKRRPSSLSSLRTFVVPPICTLAWYPGLT